MATYTSWETEKVMTIRCRYADRPEMGCPDGAAAVAVALRGQWQGGDCDVDPIWVPVCEHHDQKWDTNYDTEELTPERYRLPRFALADDKPVPPPAEGHRYFIRQRTTAIEVAGYHVTLPRPVETYLDDEYEEPADVIKNVVSGDVEGHVEVLWTSYEDDPAADYDEWDEYREEPA